MSKVFTFLCFSQGLEDGQGEEGEEGDVLHCSSLSVETVQCSADLAASLAFYNPSTDLDLCVMPRSSQAPSLEFCSSQKERVPGLLRANKRLNNLI